MNRMLNVYRGGANVDFIGPRRRWYVVSGILILVCVASFALRGFNFGIDFSGGNSFTVDRPAGSSLSQATKAVQAAGVQVETAQKAGSGSQQKYVLKTKELSTDESDRVSQSLAKSLHISADKVSSSSVSSSWGAQITRKGLIALVVFLVLVGAYIGIWFERKMAIAALAALLHDLLLTAGVYSLVGFEVTPSTVIGLLTILGYSLYDTVVVFDKVKENTASLLKGDATLDYAQAANLAVNETIMRSINTTVFSLLPVGGLLFVGAGLLGVGTLKDLALVLFVGLLVGAYSSLFLATPWLVDLKEREPRYAALKRKVAARLAPAMAGATITSGASATENDEDGDDTGSAAVRSGASPGKRRGKHGRTVSAKRGRT